jgi:hypothetical protein
MHRRVRAGSEQHAWLLADLASVDRSVTPWLVVGGHRPVYICSTNTMPGQGDQPVAQDLRDAFEEAFVEHKVSALGAAACATYRERARHAAAACVCVCVCVCVCGCTLLKLPAPRLPLCLTAAAG